MFTSVKCILSIISHCGVRHSTFSKIVGQPHVLSFTYCTYGDKDDKNVKHMKLKNDDIINNCNKSNANTINNKKFLDNISFVSKQTVDLYGNSQDNPNSSTAAIKHLLLNAIGVKDISVAKMMENHNEIFNLDITEIKHRIRSLFTYKFNNNQVRYIISNHPFVLLLPAGNSSRIMESILTEIGIKFPELHMLVMKAPCVLLDDITVTKDKFLYFDLIMGEKNNQAIVESGAMKFHLSFLQERHEFLFRRGQYMKIDRHGNSRITNPSLAEMFCTTTDLFCQKIAICDTTEFLQFRRIFNQY